mgnify:CR=1 FL=1
MEKPQVRPRFPYPLRQHTYSNSTKLTGRGNPHACLRAKAQLDWRGAEVVMSPVKPLGEYRALINATGSAADLQLSTLSGALKLNGKGNWTLKDGARFSGTAQSDPAQAANIDPLLQLMGKPAFNGAYPLDWPAK